MLKVIRKTLLSVITVILVVFATVLVLGRNIKHIKIGDYIKS